MSPFKWFRPSTKLLPLSSDWLEPRGKEAWVQCHCQFSRWWKKMWRRGTLPLPFNLERGCAFTIRLLSNTIYLILKPTSTMKMYNILPCFNVLIFISFVFLILYPLVCLVLLWSTQLSDSSLLNQSCSFSLLVLNYANRGTVWIYACVQYEHSLQYLCVRVCVYRKWKQITQYATITK